MSGHNDFEFPSIPSQDFTPLGIDSDTATLIASDIVEDNPQRYQNAGIWAEVLSEQAKALCRGELRGVDTQQFTTHLYTNLVHAFEEDDSRSKAAARFVDCMDSHVISDTASYDFDEGFSTYHTWNQAPRTIGEYVEARLEYKDQGRQARRIMGQLADIENLATPDAERLLDELAHITERRRDLKAQGFSGYSRRRYGGWSLRGEYPDIGYDDGYESLDAHQIESSKVKATQKLKLRSVLESLLNDLAEMPDQTARLGAKGANLTRLVHVVNGIKDVTEIGEYIDVPPFTILDTTVFEKWQAGERITADIRAARDWIHATDPNAHYFVRSSAVKSEDGEHMGAGVYDSVLLPLNANPMQLFQAIKKVYFSTTSPAALAYQAQIGVTDEKMAVVIQQSAGDIKDIGLITINSVVAHVPELVDYQIEQGEHPITSGGVSRVSRLPLDRRGVESEFGLSYDGNEYASRFHVPPDLRFQSLMDSYLAAQALMIGEKALGGLAQVEAVVPGDVYGVRIVQARPLPSGWLERVPFGGFPSEEPWYDGRGIGVFENIEYVAKKGNPYSLERYLKKNPGNVLLQFDNSFAANDIADGLRQIIPTLSPKDKSRVAFLVKHPPEAKGGSGFGHIETMCAELSVPMIFASENGSICRSFVDGQTVRAYSDGYKAKLYSSEDDPARRKASADLYDK